MFVFDVRVNEFFYVFFFEGFVFFGERLFFFEFFKGIFDVENFDFYFLYFFFFVII